MADKLGWKLTNLARQGCSNGGIRIQIDEIRRQKPDFAIVIPTMWDRFEIPARAAPFAGKGGEYVDMEEHLRDRSITNGYDRAAGINNVNYGNNNYRMICETITSLAENYPHDYRSSKINKDTQTAIKHYINYLYDSNWKKQMDEWIIVEGLLQMFLEGIKFITFPGLLWPFDPDNQKLWRASIPTFIPDHFVVTNEAESVLAISGNNPCGNVDPGYHSNAQGQKIIADNWYKRITVDHGIN